ncbi:MAG: AtpZ/AtpI family protein, partial [Mesoflavibacter sp.]|nr:AtpZ/AtpI family protein [Mesoflavibacter sp.]
MEPQKPKKQLKQLAALTGIAIQMGVTIYLFVLLGKWLDSKYTESGKTFL